MKLAMMFVCAAVAGAQTPSAQNQERVFQFMRDSSPQDLNAALAAIRAGADIPNLSLDSSARTLTVNGPADRVALAEWLFHELDQASPSIQEILVHEFQTTHGDELVRVFYLARAQTAQALTEAAVAVRTMVDKGMLVLQYPALRAVVARGPADQMEIGDWLFHELDQPAAKTLTTGTYGVPVRVPGRSDEVVKVFHLAHLSEPQSFADLVVAIHTTAGIQRIFRCIQPRAVAVRGTAGAVDQAERLVKQRDQAGAM